MIKCHFEIRFICSCIRWKGNLGLTYRDYSKYRVLYLLLIVAVHHIKRALSKLAYLLGWVCIVPLGTSQYALNDTF